MRVVLVVLVAQAERKAVVHLLCSLYSPSVMLWYPTGVVLVTSAWSPGVLATNRSKVIAEKYAIP